ncbi:MAG TPA: hypothetical protein VH276_09135 [Solirubrobacteraceae bacterium]|nr:hypothetical protein [Solirubrobacteraceae bacterium]
MDSAVIAAQDRAGSCESELEVLMGEGPMRLSVSRVSVRSDLATATVSTAHSAAVPVDLVRDGRRWLLSFSQGQDPLPALTS